MTGISGFSVFPSSPRRASASRPRRSAAGTRSSADVYALELREERLDRAREQEKRNDEQRGDENETRADAPRDEPQETERLDSREPGAPRRRRRRLTIAADDDKKHEGADDAPQLTSAPRCPEDETAKNSDEERPEPREHGTEEKVKRCRRLTAPIGPHRFFTFQKAPQSSQNVMTSPLSTRERRRRKAASRRSSTPFVFALNPSTRTDAVSGPETCQRERNDDPLARSPALFLRADLYQ